MLPGQHMTTPAGSWAAGGRCLPSPLSPPRRAGMGTRGAPQGTLVAARVSESTRPQDRANVDAGRRYDIWPARYYTPPDDDFGEPRQRSSTTTRIFAGETRRG